MLKGRGFDAVALEGEKSQYDVVRGGEVLISKLREGRFPDEYEILAALRA